MSASCLLGISSGSTIADLKQLLSRHRKQIRGLVGVYFLLGWDWFSTVYTLSMYIIFCKQTFSKRSIEISFDVVVKLIFLNMQKTLYRIDFNTQFLSITGTVYSLLANLAGQFSKHCSNKSRDLSNFEPPFRIECVSN